MSFKPIQKLTVTRTLSPSCTTSAIAKTLDLRKQENAALF